MRMLMFFLALSISTAIVAQKPTGPIYLAPKVTTADSVTIDSLWIELKNAVLKSDEATVQSICDEKIGFTGFGKPDSEPGFLFLSPAEGINILKSVFNEPGFQPGSTQYFKSITSLAAAQPDKSMDANSGELNPISFSLNFMLYSSIPAGQVNRGWSFMFYRSTGKIVLWGVYKS